MNSRLRQFLLIYFALALGLLLVTWPRFDRQDLFIGAFTHPHNVDSEAYTTIAREFRNPADWQLMQRPFCFRPLTPLIASLLPFPAATAINLVNLSWLLAALFFVLKTLQLQGHSPLWQAAGGAMLVFSFPTFYYSTITLVDPGILFICALGAYYLKRERIVSAVILTVLGMLIMEKAVLLLPAIFGTLVARNRRPAIAAAIVLAVFLVCMGILSLLQQFGPVEKGDSYFWNPQIAVLLKNASRLEFWIGSLLSFGLPGALTVFWLTRHLPAEPLRLTAWHPWLPNLLGILGGIALWCWALVSAHGDGRSLWLIYPFMIPLAVRALQIICHDPANPVYSQQTEIDSQPLRKITGD